MTSQDDLERDLVNAVLRGDQADITVATAKLAQYYPKGVDVEGILHKWEMREIGEHQPSADEVAKDHWRTHRKKGRGK